MSEKLLVNISDRKDGYGFYYGDISLGEVFYSVTILPPKSLWSGDTKLEGYEPDQSHWIVFIDGNEYARVSQKEDIVTTLRTYLLPSASPNASN